jgi:hypothetical protein
MGLSNLPNRGLLWVTYHRRVLFVALLLLKSLLVFLRMGLYFKLQSGRWYNFVSYWDFASAAAYGYFPYVHYWVEYPPVFPWLATLLYMVSALAGNWAQPLFYTLILLLLLAADCGCVLMVYRIGQIAYGDDRLATLAGALQVLLFVPVYLYTGWFDTLPTLLLLAALLQILQGRSLWAGFWAGLGTLTKFFPGVTMVVGWRYLRGSWKTLFLVAFGVTVLLIMLPLVMKSPVMTLASIHGYFSRPSWETVWALIDGYYGSGGHPSPEMRFDPNAGIWIQHSSQLPSWLPALLLISGVSLALFYRFDLRSPVQAIALTGFLLNILLLTSKGYSPQYLTWIIPVVALLAVRRVVWLPVGIGLAVVNLIEYPLYFHTFSQEPAVLVAAVIVRNSLLLVSLGLQWRLLTSQDKDLSL